MKTLNITKNLLKVTIPQFQHSKLTKVSLNKRKNLIKLSNTPLIVSTMIML